MRRPGNKGRARNLILCGLVVLIVVFSACLGEESPAEPDPFVLGDDDTPLDCDPSGEDESALACQLAYYTNRERNAHPEESDEAEPLDWSRKLAEVARRYSRRMCDEDFFDHIDPHDHGLEHRLNEAGIFYVKAGENLARGTRLHPSEAMSLFMDEPPCEPNHRGNVLDNDFTHVGVGAVFCGSKTIYTQLFATFEVEDLRTDENEYCSKR